MLLAFFIAASYSTLLTSDLSICTSPFGVVWIYIFVAEVEWFDCIVLASGGVISDITILIFSCILLMLLVMMHVTARKPYSRPWLVLLR